MIFTASEGYSLSSAPVLGSPDNQVGLQREAPGALLLGGRQHKEVIVSASPSVSSPESRFFALQIIRFALMVSVIVYGVVTTMLSQTSSREAMENEDLVWMLQLAAGLLFIAGFLVYRRIAPSLSTEQSSEERIKKAFPQFIISWALFEGIAVMGFMLSFLSNNPAIYYTYGGLALIAILAHPPRRTLLIPPTPRG